MFSTEQSKAAYKAPALEASKLLPDILCDSVTDGSLEDLTEEEWII